MKKTPFIIVAILMATAIIARGQVRFGGEVIIEPNKPTSIEIGGTSYTPTQYANLENTAVQAISANPQNHFQEVEKQAIWQAFQHSVQACNIDPHDYQFASSTMTEIEWVSEQIQNCTL